MTGPGLFDPPEPPRTPVDLPAGARFLPGWLTRGQQQWIVRQYVRRVEGPVPPRRPFYGTGRWNYHGVPRVFDGTAPPGCGITGRLNITLRETGLAP